MAKKKSYKIYQRDIPEDMVSKVYQAGVMACDIETNGLDYKTCKIAMFQFFTPGIGAVLIRTHHGHIPYRLSKLLQDERVLKIFHFAFGDCCFLNYRWGVEMKNVICTKIAAKVIALKKDGNYRLDQLLSRYLRVKVDKVEQLSNWFAPRLTQKQKEYAAGDVLHLIKLAEKLLQKLGEVMRLEDAQMLFASIPMKVMEEVEGYAGIFGDIYQYK